MVFDKIMVPLKTYKIVFEMNCDKGSRKFYDEFPVAFFVLLLGHSGYLDDEYLKGLKEMDEPQFYGRYRVVSEDRKFRLEMVLKIDSLDRQWVFDQWKEYLEHKDIFDEELLYFEEVEGNLDDLFPEFVKSTSSTKYFPFDNFGKGVVDPKALRSC